MKELKATCNIGCQKVFTVKYELELLHDGIVKTFFTCPECKEEYLCLYTDPEIRILQKAIRRIDKAPKMVTGEIAPIFRQAADKRHAELRADITAKMRALKEKMEGENNAEYFKKLR